MSSSTFARARTDEQRAERREAILATAATMLESSRVSDLSLNELSRRVGLAKSNVLRYFESREAVLLELYARENAQWLDAIELALGRVGDAGLIDDAVVARIIAEQSAAMPVFCDLVASSAGVLERNVSADVAAEYKRHSLAATQRLVEIVGDFVGPLDQQAGLLFVGAVLLTIGGVWASSQPSPGMKQAYAQHPEFRDFRLDFTFAVTELLTTILAGIRARNA